MLPQASQHGNCNSVTASVATSCTISQLQHCNSWCCYRMHSLITAKVQLLLLLQAALFLNSNTVTASLTLVTAALLHLTTLHYYCAVTVHGHHNLTPTHFVMLNCRWRVSLNATFVHHNLRNRNLSIFLLPHANFQNICWRSITGIL